MRQHFNVYGQIGLPLPDLDGDAVVVEELAPPALAEALTWSMTEDICVPE